VTILWVAAVAMLVLALLFVVPPLVVYSAGRPLTRAEVSRRVHADQLARIEKDFQAQALSAQDRAQAIDEVQRQVLQEASHPTPTPRTGTAARPWMRWGVAGVLSAGLPVAALLLYMQVGDPMTAATQVLAAQGSHKGDGNEVEGMVSRLAARLQAQPGDAPGWIMLARSYEYLLRFDDAVVAYQKALALAPGQPQLLADYADALGSARDGDLGGPAQEAIEAALAMDPDHPKSLALAGMAAYKRGDLAQARQHWEKVLAILPADADAARKIVANIAKLDSAKTGSAGVSAMPKRVSGTVSIDPSLVDRALPQDTVFVLAKAAATGRMPVAVLRLQVKDLPAQFVLDDSLAMSADRPISRFNDLTLEVRVTRTGQAAPQRGDLGGAVADVKLGQTGIDLQADKVVNDGR
jgi:cytochrome c-type biogenesis protein CcmH